MKIIPLLTEKSLKETKKGGFTFLVPTNLDKPTIKSLIGKTFGVDVTGVKTISYKPRTKRNARGVIQKVKGYKKAILYLKEGQKIALFEEEKKPKAKKKGKNAKA